jgi:DNA-binding HxlR family transcriptional regulator
LVYTIKKGSDEIMRAKSSNWKTGCSVEVALSVIGGIWKPVILFHLLDRKMRFGELSRLVPNATQRMLTLQLRELEADKVITRTVYPEVPPRVEYSLTELGKTLEPVLLNLRDWGDQYKFRKNTHE